MEFSETQFHGAGYDKDVDHERLTGQLQRIYYFMASRKEKGLPWVTLREIANNCQAPEASASAALRSLRNEHGYRIDRARSADGIGTWLYRIGIKDAAPRKRKMKPIGNHELFGQMMRAIYAFSASSTITTEFELRSATEKWARDMAANIKK